MVNVFYNLVTSKLATAITRQGRRFANGLDSLRHANSNGMTCNNSGE